MNDVATKEWLRAALDDLIVIEKIVDDPHITNMSAFHAQQAVEKSIKALLEYHKQAPLKKHDLITLKAKAKEYIQIDDEDILEDLNTLYIESRYPGSLGLLPYGKPTLEDAQRFCSFAEKIFQQVCALVAISLSELQ